MSSTALSVCPHLPPTTNFLNSQQRMRLMRSTRKLGAVLGTTPYLLENETSFAILPLGKSTSKALKRQGSVFTHKQPSSLSITSISSTSSHFPSPSTSVIDISRSVTPGTQCSDSNPISPPGLSTAQKRRPREKPPQLCLQLNTAPISPVKDNFLSLTPSPYPSPCPSPVTPTTPIPDLSEVRRKRMAKLARHLGEKIPVELVLNCDSSPASQDRSPRRRSQSVHVTRSETLRHRQQSQSRQEWVGEWNRSNIRDVQKELRNLKIR